MLHAFKTMCLFPRDFRTIKKVLLEMLDGYGIIIMELPY